MKLAKIDIEKIEIGERFRKDYGDVESLAKSIKQKGLIQPIAVMQKPGEDCFLLLAGGRRMQACKLSLIKEVPARIFDRELNELEIRSIELAENFDRKDLSWEEQVVLQRKIHELQEEIHGTKVGTSANSPGWSMRDTAKLLNSSPASVSQDINLAKAVEMFPNMFKGVKNKSEAQKILKNAEKLVKIDELSKSFEKKSTSIDKKTLIDSFVIKDFFEGVKDIPDAMFDLAEIDPPYGVDLTAQKKDYGGRYAGYNEVPAEEYDDFLMRMITETGRVMKPNSWMLIWLPFNSPVDRLSMMLKTINFTLCPIPAIWTKPSGQTQSPSTRLANTYEIFYYARRGSAEILQKGRSNNFNFHPVPPDKKTHPTERPIDLIKEILLTFCMPASHIFIPFLGSGNTILAAHQVKMFAVGFELTQAFKDSYIIKVHKLGK